ncbi:hypothetical protein BOTU111921_11485 [Bordetella tumbae]|uniref:hypothetical protein n=1 Tax=Bordetella tumbae TaxID=1649139 RepID=UPI0039EF7B2D
MSVVVGLGQEWRLGSQIAECQREQAQTKSDVATASLNQITNDIQNIATAAQRARETAERLPDQIGKISKALKDAQPLPDGCRPDADRVRSLADSVRAANRAATGQRTGSAMPSNSRSPSEP